MRHGTTTLESLIHAAQHNPAVALAALVTINAVAYLLYGWDKRQAMQGGWRVPERSLLMLALLGGWPASMAAQRKFRHKTQKMPFQLYFRLMVVVNIALIVGLVVQH